MAIVSVVYTMSMTTIDYRVHTVLCVVYSVTTHPLYYYSNILELRCALRPSLLGYGGFEQVAGEGEEAGPAHSPAFYV